MTKLNQNQLEFECLYCFQLIKFVGMENFVVSALKYRPKKFEDVVGQEFVTQTLQNALSRNQMPKALLFCGPRGVGKTTCARILAKAINSQTNEIKDEDFSFNIFELDAASNNSVDDIRRLNEQVRIPPQHGSHKIYIIDEAHMLSTQAFNAFLKTLEEPPDYVIFILATTEKNKILPTILSRCQVYDFRRISSKEIVNYLSQIVREKNIDYQEDALFLIAQKADGAMRDALSIFDRMISFTNGNLSSKLVAENLNILDFKSYEDIVQKIAEKKLSDLILQYNKLFERGFDNHEFILGLGDYFRNLLLVKNPKTARLLELGENVIESLKKQSRGLGVRWILEVIDLIQDCEINYKNSHNKQLHVEICLLRLASLDSITKKRKTDITSVEEIRKQSISSIKSEQNDTQSKNQKSLTTADSIQRNIETRSSHKSSEKRNSKEHIEVNKEVPTNTVEKQNSGNMQVIDKEDSIDSDTQSKTFTPRKISDIVNKELNLENLNAYWSYYADKLYNSRDVSGAGLLESGKLELKDTNHIIYHVNTCYEENLFKNLGTKLLENIKSHFGDQNLKMMAQVNKNLRPQKISKEDKKKIMIKENPAVQYLIDRFDLS